MSTRVSNETLAKALVKAFEDLDVKLDKFKKDTEKVVSKPMSVDTTQLNESVERFRKVTHDLNNAIIKLSQQTTNPRAMWYSIVTNVVFGTAIIMGVVLYFRMEAYSEKMRDIQKLENVKDNFDLWFKEKPEHSKAFDKWIETKKQTTQRGGKEG